MVFFSGVSQLGEAEAAFGDEGGGVCADDQEAEVSDFVDVAGLRDDEFRGGGFGLFRDLRWGEERVRGGGDCAEKRGGEEGENELRRVREKDHHDVVLAHAELAKTGGEFA